MKTFVGLKWIGLIGLLCINLSHAVAQSKGYKILSPQANSIIGNDNLLVAVQFDTTLNENSIELRLDNMLLSGITKFKQNKLEFLYLGTLANGKHLLKLSYKLKGNKQVQHITWLFYVNYNSESLKKGDKKIKQNPWYLSGSIVADNRNTQLDGEGALLRQEPAFTRTISADVTLNKGDLHIPIRYFNTSDNRFGMQSRNFFQVGLHYKWLNIDYGDINPNMDRLILSGVRMRGVGVKLKAGKSSITYFQGSLNNSIEGNIANYANGEGFIPTNIINDSQYLLPGTYQRNMLATRLELVGRKDNFRLGLNAFKAKDDTASIKNGVLPKDNVAAGADLVIRLFKKSVALSGGVATSVVTNDISYGVIDPLQVDTTFGIKLGFDPAKYQNIIIINASTVPTVFNTTDVLAYYGTFSINNRFQNFTAEYRHNGGAYQSLGNPFLRRNYKGYTLTERFGLFKRKLNFNFNYQNYSNNLNQSLPALLQTEVMAGGLMISIKPKLPSLSLNYQVQNRNSMSTISVLPSVKDRVITSSLYLFYSTRFWSIKHDFRAFYSKNERKDLIQNNSGNTFENYLFGLTENFTDRFSINVDYGQSNMVDYFGKSINTIQTLGVLLNAELQKQKFFLNAGVNQNKSRLGSTGGEQTRMGYTLRLQYYIIPSIILETEGGYIPFRDMLESRYNYQEKYVYVRLSYLFLRKKPKV
jgi:hypothetical protein